MNICVFGDSVAKGVVFDEVKNKYTFLKESFLNIVGEKTSVNFKNFARFGCTVTKGQRIMDKHEGSLSDYNYAILEFGGNDCDLEWAEIADTPHTEHRAHVPLDEFEEIYSSMIERTRLAGTNPILLTLPPLDSERFFNWVSKDLNKVNIMEFLEQDISRIFRWQEGYNDMVYKLARKLSVPIIDIRSAFTEHDDYRSLLCVDGMHPNKEGHRAIARCMEQSIANLI